MTDARWPAAYAAAALTLAAADILWLGVVARDFYWTRLGHLTGDSVRWGPAAAFYILYSAGVCFFAVRPALAAGALSSAVLHGALLGLLAYGTYDLTNQAVLRGWPGVVTAVDIAWGTLLTAAVAAAGFLAARRFSTTG